MKPEAGEMVRVWGKESPGKEELERILGQGEWDSLRQWAVQDNSVSRLLQSRIYTAEGLLLWRAVEGLGRVSSWLDGEKPGYAAELVRRYFWSLNEESGGTAWNAGQAIGSIMAHCPDNCGHFNWSLSDLLSDPSLRAGALWGLWQLALVAPRWVIPLEERLSALWRADEPEIRTLTAMIYHLMSGSDLPGGNWQIPGEIAERLAGDDTPVTIYQDGQLRRRGVRTWLLPT